MVNCLLTGFESKLTTSKWAKIAKSSQDTALRDIDELVRQGVLAKGKGGGRSSNYVMVEEARDCLW
jgi:Fic family protein